jgi:hypothetical protein
VIWPVVVWQVEKLRKYGFMVRDIAWDSPFLGLAVVYLLGISFCVSRAEPLEIFLEIPGFEPRKPLRTNNLAIRFSLKMKYNGVAASYLAISNS